MAIQFSCKQCGKAYKVDDALAGKRVKCKTCGAGLVIPAAASPAMDSGHLYDLDDESEASPPAAPSPSGAYLARGQGRATASSGGPPWGLIVGGGAGLVALVVIAGIVLSSGGGSSKPRPSGPEKDVADAGPAEPETAPPAAVAAKPDGRFIKPVGPAAVTAATAPWRVKIDPAPADLAAAFPPGKEMTLPIPESYSSDFILFPTSPSPFVCVGGNGSDTQKRVVYDLRDGKPVGSLSGRLDLNEPMALSPDGRFLAAYANTPPRKTVIWSVADAAQVGAIAELGEAPAHIVDFAGPSKVLITASYYKRIEVWDFEKGQKVADVKTAEGWAWERDGYAISPGRRYVALGYDAQQRLRVYDLTTSTLEGELEVPKQGSDNPDFVGVAFSPEGKALTALVKYPDEHHLLTWDVATGKLEANLTVQGKDPFGKATYHHGPKLSWLPDSSGWFVYDQAIVERRSGQVAWSLPFDSLTTLITAKQGYEEAPRKILDTGRAAMVVKQNNNRRLLKLVALPQEKIQAALSAARSGGSAVDATLGQLAQVDLAGAKRVSLTGEPAWAVVAEPSPKPAKPLSGRPIATKVPANEVIELQLAGASGGMAALLSGQGGRLEAFTREAAQEVRHVDRIDLAAGRVVNRFDIPAVYLLSALSPKGTRLLVTPGRARDRVDVFSAGDGKLVTGWRPISRREGETGALVTWADFLDEDRVFTADAEGTVVLWSLPEVKPIYAIEKVAVGVPALSPSRQVLVLFAAGAAWFLDPATGAAKGKVALTSTSSDRARLVAFRGDGAELAAVLGETLARIDLKTGKIAQEVPVPVRKPWFLQYCGAGDLLFDGQYVFDLEHQRVVWNVGGGLPGVGSTDGLYWFAAGANSIAPVSLASRALPGKEAEQMVAEAFKPGVKALLAPGGSVAIQVEGNPPRDAESFRAQVIADAGKWLSEQGIQVSDQAASRIVVKFSERDTGHTMEIRRFGTGNTPEVRTIAARELITELSVLDKQGPPIVLAKRATGPPMFGSARIAPGDNDWEGALRIQQWNEAARQLLGGGLPFFAMRRGPGGSIVLPGLTSLGDPKFVPSLEAEPSRN